MKNYIRFYFGIFFLLFCVRSLFSQEYKTIRGRIIDASDKVPLAFVSIGIVNTNAGTISNYNGQFVINLQKNACDSLQISRLGYITKIVSVLKEDTSELIIVLKPSTYYVDEITISPNASAKIISDALAKVPENYPCQPLRLTAFYRETATENGVYIQYVEAVLGVYKAAYNDKKYDQIKILKGRNKSDVAPSEIWNYIDIVNGTYEMIQSDIAKYPNDFLNVSQNQLNFLNPKYFKFYDYALLNSSSNENADMYIVMFAPNRKSKRAVYEGQIFIDRKTLAIIQLQFTIAANRIKYASVLPSDTELYLYQEQIDAQTVNFECTVNYKTFNSKWILSDVEMKYSIIFNSSTKDIFSYLANNVNFVVTDIDTTDVQEYKSKEKVRFRQSLVEQIGEPDAAFWENFNFIKYESKYASKPDK